MIRFANAYEQLVRWIGERTGAPDSVLHIDAGMAVFLIARLVTGRSLSNPVPFAVVCVAEFLNELIDRISHGSWAWRDTSMDVLNTLLWPFLVMVSLRLRAGRE